MFVLLPVICSRVYLQTIANASFFFFFFGVCVCVCFAN